MGERFISRWARLKRSREQAPPSADEDKAALGHSDAARPAASGPLEAHTSGSRDLTGQAGAVDTDARRPDEATVAAAPVDPNEDLPPIESLTQNSDFTPFLRRGVASGARNAALKKLFADPHYNVMDGLDVYIDDYNIAEPVPGQMLARLLREHASPILTARGEASATGEVSATIEANAVDDEAREGVRPDVAPAQEQVSLDEALGAEDGAGAEGEADVDGPAGARHEARAAETADARNAERHARDPRNGSDPGPAQVAGRDC